MISGDPTSDLTAELHPLMVAAAPGEGGKTATDFAQSKMEACPTTDAAKANIAGVIAQMQDKTFTAHLNAKDPNSVARVAGMIQSFCADNAPPTK